MTYRLVPFVLLACLPASAIAQGPLSPGAFEATMGTGPIAQALRGQEGSAAPAPAGAATTTFKRDPALLKAKEAKLVGLMRQQSPEGAAELEKLFAQDLMTMVAPEFRRMGLNPQDAADMTTLYWVAAWEASHGIVGRPTDPAVVKGARNQLARILVANPAMATASDADKQDIADTMFLQAVLVEARMGAAAKAGPAMQQQTSDAVYKEAAQMLKTDLRKVTLTAAGFAPSGQAAGQP